MYVKIYIHTHTNVSLNKTFPSFLLHSTSSTITYHEQFAGSNTNRIKMHYDAHDALCDLVFCCCFLCVHVVVFYFIFFICTCVARTQIVHMHWLLLSSTVYQN